ncbi:MAG: sulfatase-like hydrolase/transferase [Prosthecobacter sp.]|jgi:arylsulfatase A-like enzyme|uniref:sulfatase family protein n=1 Tax=Prosthecobacter sp. TaxID=1965333 RepID=UPI0019E23245|nr:sulfatase-like hydrolase/transferase [Prosthecobacter sp.]MBE2283319.1 sulfatase-like hydrolase/transferase [Prosthecobacter sp.]
MKTLSLGFFLFAFCSSLLSADRPNIIFILADDLGWGDLGCYGHPYAKTPNLDKLAADGTRFTKFHATGVTCCPARTGLMTGKFPATFQKYPADFGFGSRVTITELLKKNGYTTGHFGKWHIGSVMEPGTYGIEVIGAEEKEGGKRRQAAGDRSRDAPMYDQAISFIEKHKAGPFYINIWDHISHHPVNPSPAVLERFEPLELDESKFTPAMREKFDTCKKLGGDPAAHLRAFLADVKSMDDEIGRLLAKLDELGLRENTLVVFSSDQGAAPLQDPTTFGDKKKKRLKHPQGTDIDDIRLNAMGYAGPLFRGGKHTDLEGGVCVPFIARWPAKVPAGRVDDQSVLSGADWLPSLCAITGIAINAADFDGEDSSKALLGGVHVRTKALFWKTNTERSDPSLLEGAWKLHGTQRRNSEVTLFNLADDPGEKNNLAEKEPEMLKKLTAQLNAWTATLPKTYEHGTSKEE